MPGSPLSDGTVVAAAILDGAGRVLVARRAYPATLAGQWEFPGGKLEAGEDESTALVRELREELGVDVAADRFLGEVPLPGGHRLRLWSARLTRGTPHPHEHAELRWVTAAELPGLDWLEPDRPLLPVLADLLKGSGS